MAELDVYEILVAEHQAMLRAYVTGLVGDASLAEDICQDAFVQAYRRLGQLKEKGAFPAWLRAIGRNLALAELKRRRRETAVDPQVLAGMEDVFAALDANPDGNAWEERALQVRSCFDRLPEPLRECCRLHYFKGFSAREAAEALGTSLAAVLKRLERARTALLKCVEDRLRLEET